MNKSTNTNTMYTSVLQNVHTICCLPVEVPLWEANGSHSCICVFVYVHTNTNKDVHTVCCLPIWEANGSHSFLLMGFSRGTESQCGKSFETKATENHF